MCLKLLPMAWPTLDRFRFARVSSSVHESTVLLTSRSSVWPDVTQTCLTIRYIYVMSSSYHTEAYRGMYGSCPFSSFCLLLVLALIHCCTSVRLSITFAFHQRCTIQMVQYVLCDFACETVAQRHLGCQNTSTVAHAETWTQVGGFRVHSANHYTTRAR